MPTLQNSTNPTPKEEHQNSDMVTNRYSDASSSSAESIPHPVMHPPAPRMSLTLSDSSIITSSSATTMFSKASEHTDITNFTTPNRSPVQEKKDSLNSILSQDDDRGALTDSIVSAGSASDGTVQHILKEPSNLHRSLKHKRVSFGNPNAKLNSSDADVGKPENMPATQSIWVDSPKSSSTRLSEASEVQTKDRLEVHASLKPAPVRSQFPWNLRPVPLVPRITDSPTSFLEKKEGKIASIGEEPQSRDFVRGLDIFDMERTDSPSPSTRGPEVQILPVHVTTPIFSQEHSKGDDPGVAQGSKVPYAQPSAGRQDVRLLPDAVNLSPHLSGSKRRNKMGAVKITKVAHYEDSMNPITQGVMVSEPKEELEADPWGLYDPPSPIDYQDEVLDHLQAEDDEEKEALLKYTVLANDEQKKRATDIESVIDEDVRDFFDKRDIDKARTYFIFVSEEHRYKLVAQLAMFAIRSEGEINALLAAELFDKSTENDWCSASDYEKAARLIVEEMNRDPSVDVSVASYRLGILLEGMELSEAFKSSLRQLYCGEFLFVSRSSGNGGRSSPPAITRKNNQSTSPIAHKVKID